MGRSGKNKKQYVECLGGKLQLTCLVHVHGNSSKQFKSINVFGGKYSYLMTTKERE